MSSSVGALNDAQTPSALRHPATAGQPPVGSGEPALREGVLDVPGAMPLHLGGRLDHPRIAWRVYGDPRAPLIVALGGISAGRAVAETPGGQKGWWAEIVRANGSLDSSRWQILGIDYLGGSGASTGPAAGQTNFPSISAYDQAEAVRRVLQHLAVPRAAAIVGASYGGMVALAFAERWPALVERIVVISAAHRSHPMSTAWRSVQRAMVRYALGKGDGPEGLRLARALAMATYRTPQEFAARFAGPAVRIEGRFQFPVESYLLARGDAYASSYLPEAFVCLSESIDLHQVDARKIRTPATLVGVAEDQLVPIEDLRALRQQLAGDAELVEISSTFGHDAFLKEAVALKAIFERALSGAGEAP